MLGWAYPRLSLGHHSAIMQPSFGYYSAIIRLLFSQDYVGSNGIPLLEPLSQFGYYPAIIRLLFGYLFGYE